MIYDIVKTWAKCTDKLPEDGTLCVVMLPVGIEAGSGRCIGPTATAYYRPVEGRWVYADTPSALRFAPYYWVAMDDLATAHFRRGDD